MINWQQKLSSRKFWALLAGLAIAVMVLMGAPGVVQTQVVSVITALGSIVIYMWGETTVDAARISAGIVQKQSGKESESPESDPG